MNFLYIANYLIFAVFFTLFTFELGIALTLLLDNRAEVRKRAQNFIAPLWQVIGTFAVFYLVNFEATYPQLLDVVGYAYILPLMLAALFFILRNAFISYAAYSVSDATGSKYLKFYGIATLVTYFLVLSVFSSAISGAGINVGNASIDMLTVLFNQFNLVLFLGLVMLALFSTATFFEIREGKRVNASLGLVSFALLATGSVLYLPFMFQGFLTYFCIAALAIFLFAYLFLSLRGSGMAKQLSILWPLILIICFGMLQYPNVFGGAASLLSYITNSASGFWISLISVIGGALVTLYLIYFVWIVYLRKRADQGEY